MNLPAGKENSIASHRFSGWHQVAAAELSPAMEGTNWQLRTRKTQKDETDNIVLSIQKETGLPLIGSSKFCKRLSY